MRVAALILPNAVNIVYRTLIPMRALASRGHSVRVEDGAAVQRRAQLLLEFDVVHVWRLFDDDMQQLARQLRRAGVAIVWDNDDELHAEKGDPSYKRLGGLRSHEHSRGMKVMMRVADVVTTPSEELATRYRAVTDAEVQVLENYLSPDFVRRRGRKRRRRSGPLTIGWVAALEHRVDYERLGLRATLVQLLERFPHVELTTIGVHLALDHPRYRHIPPAPYDDLPELLSELDVGIAPLADMSFNRARSNIKLKEYAAAGIPWLASPVGPYAGLGEQQGGVLVGDDEWAAALEAIVVDDKRRGRLASQGETWAQSQLIDHHAGRWEHTLERAVRLARSRA